METKAGKGRVRHITAIAALVLVVTTALIGAAARGKGSAPGTAIPSTGSAPTQFSAPGGGPVTFTGTLDRTAVRKGSDGRVRLELVIAAQPQPGEHAQRVPTDLMVILDRSGSMAGEKLEQARAAVRALIAQLGPEDRFGFVTYSNDARLEIPLTAAGDRERGLWLSVLNTVSADGGTNMSSGLDLGLDTVERGRGAGRVARVILLSDGLANQGDSSHDGLIRRATRAARGEYALTTIGVGADFNEELMTALADAGTGNYYYVKAGDDLSEVFAREFDAARTTVARGLAVQIEPGSGIQVVDAAGYPLERTPSGVSFRPGALFAGQTRRIWVTLAVPSSDIAERDLGRFALSYGDGVERTTLQFSDTPRVACVQSDDEFYAKVDVSSWARSVVVDGYNEMQEEVAHAVKEGNREKALGIIAQFRDDTKAMNARLQSPAVESQLFATDKLEADVAASFSGPNQPASQNELSKARGVQALDARRAGSKR